MQKNQTNKIVQKINRQIIYYEFILCFIAIGIDLILKYRTSQQTILNTIILSILAISISLLYYRLIPVSSIFGIINYLLLSYFIATFYFNLSYEITGYYLLKHTIIVFVIISLTGFILNKKHILLFGLIYSFSFGVFTIINENSIFAENLPTIAIFIFSYSLFMFFVSGFLKNLLHEQILMSNRINLQNQELSQQADTLKEINKLLSEQTSEIRIQQKELEKLNSTKDKFLSLFAHDLKTPLNSIIGFAELLEMKFDDLNPAKKQTYIHTIKNSAENTYKLIENLLEWSMSQSNNIAYTPKEHHLEEIVDDVIELLKSSADKKKIRLVKNNIKHLIIFADKYMITTVVRNLLANAIKYSRQNSNIIISAHEEKAKATISIIDNGIGMTEEQIDALFKIESSVSTIGTSGEKGTGLGLIICADFIRKHNSNIKVTSEPSSGTTFSFDIPMIKNLIVTDTQQQFINQGKNQ